MGAINFTASCLSSCVVHGLMLSTIETWGALKLNAIDFARYPFWTGDCKMDESSTLVANRVASGKFRHLCDLVLVPPSSNAWATEAVLLFRRPRFRVQLLLPIKITGKKPINIILTFFHYYGSLILGFYRL